MITIATPSSNQMTLNEELTKYEQLAVGGGPNIDATVFWKANKTNFIILHHLAKTILAINPCSANAERNFSIAGLQLIAKRASQNPHRAHKALFLHDNISLISLIK